MKEKHFFFRGVLWFVAVYHILAGLFALFSEAALIKLAKALAGYELGPDEALFYIAKPFGVYLIAFGVSMAVAAWNPRKNRSFLSIGVGLFALRVIQRIVSAHETQSLFNVSPGRNALTICIVAAFGVILAVFRYKIYREMQRETAWVELD